MSTIRRITVILVALIGLATSSAWAADPVADALDGFRKARGLAMAKENQSFLRWLESALNQARQQKQPAEIARLEALIGQLRTETAALLAQGDKQALLPTNVSQLRALLVGTAWHPDKKASDARMFTQDGQFKSKDGAIPYSVIGARRVNLVWAPNNRIDCEFNEDFTEMKELGGLGQVWKRIP